MDCRIGLLESLYDLRQPVGGYTEIRANINIPGRQSPDLGTVLQQSIFITDEAAQIREHRLPFTGQINTLCRPPQQGKANFFFQRCNGPHDARRGISQSFGS